VTLASAAAGVYFVASLAPERLRAEVERQVTAASGAPCRIGSLRVAPGLPIEVEGRDVRLWDGALVVAHARGRVSIASAILGKIRLSRLQLEGVTLDLREGTPGRGAHRPEAEDAGGDLLASLHAAAETTLATLALADHLVIRDARIDLAAGISLLDLHARLSQGGLRREARLVAQMRIRAGDAHRGLVEWNGSRGEDAGYRLSVAISELDLGWLATLLPDFGTRLRGWVSGVADVALSDAERARIELDLLARELGWRGFEVPRVSVRADLDVAPDRLSMSSARVRGGPVDVELDLEAARPFSPDAPLDVAARVSDLSVDELVELLTSMPGAWVEDARDVLEALDGGRVASFVARSRGPLSAWRPEPDAATRGLPAGLELSARLADLRVQLAPDDAIEDVSLVASWAGDRVSLRDVVGRRAGLDLPRLDLSLDGVSHWLAADLGRRVPDAGDVRLAGLPLLIELLEPKPGSTAPPIDVRLAHLEHPALLWPVRGLDLRVRDGGDALEGEIHAGSWAGVPLRGRLRWRSRPMHLVADLAAAAPEQTASAAPAPEMPDAPAGLPLEGVAWAAGDFEIGALASEVWSHRVLRARVRAARSRVAFDGVVADTLPSGRVEGDAILDLGRADALPYRAVFTARDLDADTLLSQAKLGRGLVAGRVEAAGDLRGRYEPGVHPSAALSGDVHLVARDGHVRHDLPAVLALTLAGEGLDFRSDRERVRYTTCESRLELRDGVAHTDALEFEGPDLRMFGSGSLDLGHPPHAIDSEVVVFLFRPVDRVLGAMPIVGSLLLGGADNLLAAYFELAGPWDAPTATYQPLRTLNTGPLRLVTGLPSVVRRGIESLGAGEDAVASEEAAPGNGVAP